MVTKQEVYELLQKNPDVAVRLIQPQNLTVDQWVETLLELLQGFEKHLGEPKAILKPDQSIIAVMIDEVQPSFFTHKLKDDVVGSHQYFVCNQTRDLFKWDGEKSEFCRVLSTELDIRYALNTVTKQLHKIHQVEDSSFLRVSEDLVTSETV